MIDAPNDPEMLADECALGLLDADAHAAAEAPIARDQNFAARVLRWEAAGHDWASTAPADEEWSADDLWRRIEAGFPAKHGASDLPRPANDTDAALILGRSASRWRLGTMAASVAALVMGGLYLSEKAHVQELGEKLELAEAQTTTAASAIRVAQVSRADGAPLLTVYYEGEGGRLTARIVSVGDQDLVPELWVIGPDGKPRSLGQGTSGSVFVVELTDQMRADIAAGSSIATSLEEAAEKPSAQPTGDRILGTAQLARVT